MIENFVEDWVIKPVKDIYATVRYKETKLSILRPEELKSELAVSTLFSFFVFFCLSSLD